MNMLKCLTIVAGLLTMLASSGSAIAIMITGTIDGMHTEFYQEDIWQIISDVTPDTKAERKLLSKSDKHFLRQIGKQQRKITRLQEKAEILELNEKQANRLLKHEYLLVRLLDSRDLLDRLLLAGVVDHNDFVLNDQTDSGITDDSFQEPTDSGITDDSSQEPTDSGITDYSSQEPPTEASVPEPSTLILLALGLLFIGVAHGKHTYRSRS